MKKFRPIPFLVLLTTTCLAGNLAGSFKEAAALEEAQPKDRATRIYANVDLNDYYQKKYIPLFQSCLKSTNDTLSFSFVVAIGADGHVLRLYTDHESNIFACVRPILQKDAFPHPPFAPYYMHTTMNFSK